MGELEDKVESTLREWEDVRGEAGKIREQFVASGPLDPVTGGLRWPERLLDAQGIKDIQDAETKAQKAWDAHLQAIEEWRKQARR